MLINKERMDSLRSAVINIVNIATHLSVDNIDDAISVLKSKDILENLQNCILNVVQSTVGTSVETLEDVYTTLKSDEVITPEEKN